MLGSFNFMNTLLCVIAATVILANVMRRDGLRGFIPIPLAVIFFEICFGRWFYSTSELYGFSFRSAKHLLLFEFGFTGPFQGPFPTLFPGPFHDIVGSGLSFKKE